jgi:hypothetical protein
MTGGIKFEFIKNILVLLHSFFTTSKEKEKVNHENVLKAEIYENVTLLSVLELLQK